MTEVQLFALLSLVAVPIYAGNILMIPAAAGQPTSHRMVMEKMSDIMQDGGHRVTWLLSHLYSLKSSHTEVHYPGINVSIDLELATKNTAGTLSYMWKIFTYMLDSCEVLLNSHNTIQMLKDEGFDLVILDAADVCGVVVAHALEVPYAVFQPIGPGATSSEAPLMLSFSPAVFLPFTDKMSFNQRVQNTVAYLMFNSMYYGYLWSMHEKQAKHLGYLVNTTLSDAYRKTSIHFTACDFSFDYPVPQLPNLICIGGVTARPAVPFHASLQKFCDHSAEARLVVISFGSSIKSTGKDATMKIAEAIRHLPYHFIWKVDPTDEIKLGKNVKAVTWLPQNDLLGHRNTALFITYGGMNGMWEAIYHGVPMLVLPIIADQIGNAVKITDRGIGLWVDFHSFTAEELSIAITEIMDNARYRQRANYISRLYHSSSQTAADRLLFWTNYLIKTRGAKHLIPESIHLNFFQYFLIDVIFLIALCIVATISTVIITIKTCGKCFHLKND